MVQEQHLRPKQVGPLQVQGAQLMQVLTEELPLDCQGLLLGQLLGH